MIDDIDDPFEYYKQSLKNLENKKIYSKIDNIKIDKDKGILSADIYINPPKAIQSISLNNIYPNNAPIIYGNFNMNDTTVSPKLKENFSLEEIEQLRQIKKQAYALMISTFAKVGLHRIVFAGGWFASSLQKEPVNDIDCFIINDPTISLIPWFDELVRTKRCERLSTDSVLYRTDSFGPNFIRGVYNDTHPANLNSGKKFQYIHTSYTTRENVLETFDFEHCKISYHNDTLYASPLSVECATKKLLYCKKNVRTSRVEKFLKRGYTWHPDSPYKIS